MVHLSTSFCATCLLGTVSIPVWLASSHDYSSVGADFAPLERHLQAQQWEAAAEEAQDLVFQISRRNHYLTIGQDMLTAQSVQNFPCKDLKSLDALWRQYSQDRFGYRSQLRAIQRQSVVLNYDKLSQKPEVWSQFVEHVGWRAWMERTEESSAVKRATDVPEGSFPFPVRSTGDFGDAAVVRGEHPVFGMSFLERARQCGVEN
jgi:GUN4-like